MTGGLGNQMFIYAFYMKMKRLFPNTRIDLYDMMHYHVHNAYELHRIFQQLPEDEFCMPQKTKKVIEFLFFKTILERKQDLTTLRAFFKRRLWPLVYFKGFYQDERYFKDIEDEVRGAFAFNTALCNEKTQRMLRQIEADEDAVSLHVRRGDYLQPSVWRNTGCLCQLPYYRDAVRQLEERLPRTPHYYVFSDDIEWATAHLPLKNATFITWNKADESWQDMLLMSRCRHHVICNSTFSWWGAWLCKFEDSITVCPERFIRNVVTKDFYPERWHKIKSC